MLCHSSSNCPNICLPGWRQPVETLVALVLFAPLTHQQALRLQSPKQRIQRTFIDRQSIVRQGLAQRVPVLLRPKLCQDRDDQTPPAQFHL